MSAVDLCVFLTSYSLVVAFAAVAEWARSRRALSLVSATVALTVIAATTVSGYYLKPGISYPELLWSLFQQRDFSALVALALGVAASLVWVVRLADRSRLGSAAASGRFGRPIIAQFLLAGSLVGVVLCCQAFIWKEIRGVQRDPAAYVNVPGFMIEQVSKLDFPPIRIAAGEADSVYVCYDYFEDSGTMGGGIVELSRDETTGQFRKKIVADSPLLMRCYGLAVRNGELFVSRSGIFPQATQGSVSYPGTGAVTRLRDVDGDGYFEFMHDIVTGLPGARGPVTMHQNNGITFDASGNLYVTTANAANRALENDPQEGAVLQINPEFTETGVFAKGFRNPFDIVVGPDNELFVTDNDIDENPGDELNHLVRGEHYGHPYVVPNESLVEAHGFREPIFTGELESNLLGMAYATSPELPESFRDCLYVADLMQNAIWRMKLERVDNTYQVTQVDRFATISSPVDIAVTSAGEFYVISRFTRNVYRIRPRQTADGRSGS